MTRRTGLVAALIVCLALAHAASASAVTLPAGSTAILSGAPSLFEPLPAPVASSELRSSAVSQNGRFVAFQSRSDGLYDGDDDSVSNVYVKDRQTGVLRLVSRATGAAGEPSHGFCYQPSISDDGSRVAFTCEEPLDPAVDKNSSTDVYVRDITSSTTHLVSRASGAGAVGDRASTSASLSETGEFVAFESESTNLDPGATTGRSRIYRRQIDGPAATILVSRRTGANGTPAEGTEPSISDDGNVIAFTGEPSEAIDPADTNNFADVYVREVTGGVTTLASRADGSGAVGNGASRAPAIAGNGTSVAFESSANQFDHDNDPDTGPDVYRRALMVKTTALVSINAALQKGNISYRPSIDDSGDVVAFVSSATALDPDDPDPRRDAYVKNLANNTVQVASRVDGAGGKVANSDAASVSVSGDGTKIGIGLDSGRISPRLDPHHSAVVLRDLAAQRTDLVSIPEGAGTFRNQGGAAYGGDLSADGRFAAFVSAAPALGLPDDTRSAVFVRDRVTGDVRLASRADGAGGAPLDIADELPSISADGRRVAFSVPTGPDRGIWVRDLAAGRTFLASRADAPDGAPANASSSYPALDADGSRVAFISYATNLGDGDADELPDVHVRDLDSGRTLLASRADNGAKGNGESALADINGDGTRIAFVSSSANLADGDTDQQADAHLRDLVTGRTTLVSATPDGTKANAFTSGAVSIDASGTRVAFATPASNLPGAGSPSNPQVYVRDLAAGTLVLASRADGVDGAVGSEGSGGPLLSPDGGYVAFVSEAPNLGTPVGSFQTYVRDLAGGRTELVSRAGGPDGAPAPSGTSPGGVSTGAACVSFLSFRALIGPESDYGQVYLRARTADCMAGTGEERDTVAPVLSGARLTRGRFRVGRAATPLAAKVRRGTVLRFRSSEAATATLTFARVVRGRQGRQRIRQAGRLTRKIGAGPARIALSGRVGRRALRAGRYRLTVRARDAAGNVSRPVRLKFKIAR